MRVLSRVCQADRTPQAKPPPRLDLARCRLRQRHLCQHVSAPARRRSQVPHAPTTARRTHHTPLPPPPSPQVLLLAVTPATSTPPGSVCVAQFPFIPVHSFISQRPSGSVCAVLFLYISVRAFINSFVPLLTLSTDPPRSVCDSCVRYLPTLPYSALPFSHCPSTYSPPAPRRSTPLSLIHI